MSYKLWQIYNTFRFSNSKGEIIGSIILPPFSLMVVARIGLFTRFTKQCNNCLHFHTKRCFCFAYYQQVILLYILVIYIWLYLFFVLGKSYFFNLSQPISILSWATETHSILYNLHFLDLKRLMLLRSKVTCIPSIFCN